MERKIKVKVKQGNISGMGWREKEGRRTKEMENRKVKRKRMERKGPKRRGQGEKEGKGMEK